MTPKSRARRQRWRVRRRNERELKWAEEGLALSPEWKDLVEGICQYHLGMSLRQFLSKANTTGLETPEEEQIKTLCPHYWFKK